MTTLRPYTLVAELTYRCPLRCLYCSNPVATTRPYEELPTETWLRVLDEAERLGVVQLNLSGGEPLLRPDLETIVARARELDLYVSLITSAVGLERTRLAQLRDAGLDAIQISIQGVDPERNAWVAGKDFHEQKLAAARWAGELSLPLTLNVVLHRRNLDAVADFIELAERLGAHRLELANTQYLGWALANRAQLLPTREQLAAARELSKAARQRLQGKLEVLFVLPDYFGDRPKACMDGWGRRFLLVAPDGRVLPCHQAATLPGLELANVADAPLADIWQSSTAFNAFRGEAWMPEPCRSCERRTIDFGGCRCQAYHLTGDASATDPACALSADHRLIAEAREQARAEPDSAGVRYRRLPILEPTSSALR